MSLLNSYKTSLYEILIMKYMYFRKETCTGCWDTYLLLGPDLLYGLSILGIHDLGLLLVLVHGL